jgi:hypothetical protein
MDRFPHREYCTTAYISQPIFNVSSERVIVGLLSVIAVVVVTIVIVTIK